MSHWRREFPEAYNKHTNTHDTIPDQVMYKCLNQSIQSTSSSVIEMRSTLNSTGKSYWVYSYEIQTERKCYTPTLKQKTIGLIFLRSTLPKRGGQVKLVIWSNLISLYLYNT